MLPEGYKGMFTDSVLKTVTAMLVSATLAIPAPLWAKSNERELPASAAHSGDTSDTTDTADTTDTTNDIPVLLEPVQLKDGRSGYFVIAPYLQEQEAQIIAN